MKTLLTSVALFLGASAAFASDLTGKTWDEIVAMAKQEGELTWYVWYLQDDLRRAIKPFEDTYGITVTIPEGSSAANADKLLAEKDRKTGDIDVFAWGFDDFAKVELSALFQGYDVLPKDAGRVNQLVGIDGGDYVLAYWGNQTGIAYDPAHVDAGALPQTPADFQAFWAANPGKFGFNYEKGGSGPSYYQNMLRVMTGVDFTDGAVSDDKMNALQAGFAAFNAQAEDYVVTASNADSITRVSDGELWMVPAWEDHLAGLQNRGEVRGDIKFYIPQMGMNGGGNGVAVPANAPHSAAAFVFVNWLTSAETQSMFNKTFGTAPMHAEASEKYALVPAEQRAYRQPWGAQPFRKEVENAFIDGVIQER